MSKYSLYSKETGEFGPVVFADSDAAVARYDTETTGIWPGKVDGARYKVDLVNGVLEEK